MPGTSQGCLSPPRTAAGGHAPQQLQSFRVRHQSQPGSRMGAAALFRLCGAHHRITGRSRAPGGRASRAATSSSSLTSPATPGEMTRAFPWPCPPRQRSRCGAGWQNHQPRQGRAPAPGRTCSGDVPPYWRSSRARPPGSPGGRAGE